MAAYGSCFGIPFGKIFKGGNLPSLSDLIQHLKGNNGREVTDILDPKVLASSVEITDVSCLDMDGTAGNNLSVLGVVPADVITMADWEFGAEEVPNNDFAVEDNTGWNNVGTAMTWTTGEGGTSALVITADDGASDRAQYSISSLGLSLGDNIRITVRAKRGIGIQQSLANFTCITIIKTPITSTTFEDYTFYGEVANAAGLIRVYAAQSGGSAGDTVIMDSISIKKITNAADFAIPTAGTNVITFTAGTVSNLLINGIPTYPCEEGEGTTAYAVDGSGDHATIVGAAWTTADGISSHNALYGWSEDGLWATQPTAGWLRTLDPNTAGVLELFSLVSTMINDVFTGTVETYTITQPTGGWLRTFNPQTATMGDFYDVAATIANEITGTAEIYTLTAATVPATAFDQSTASLTEAKAALATMLIDLQDRGIIG